MENELLKRVESALDEVRPHLQVDGGDIKVVKITDDHILKLKWIGNCQTCSMSHMTMKAGIEEVIKRYVPEIKSIEAVSAA